MSPLSIKLAKPGSSVPKADRSRMASIGSMSILSDLPRTDFTLTFGAFAGLRLPPLPELRAFGNSVSCPAIHFPLSRSEEHTSELQSQFHLVCRLLLEK